MSISTAISSDVLTEQINQIISERINEFIANYVNEHEIKLKELSLIEKIVRVEEELKSLKIIEQQRHEFLVKEMNTRFEALQKEMNTRFEAMNTRFEALQKEMDTRFEAMDKRFDSLERRFAFMQWLIASGFALVAILTTMK